MLISTASANSENKKIEKVAITRQCNLKVAFEVDFGCCFRDYDPSTDPVLVMVLVREDGNLLAYQISMRYLNPRLR